MAYRTSMERVDANFNVANDLVHNFREKAVELIASKCEYSDITECLTVARRSKGNNPPAANMRNEYSALDAPFASASSMSSQQSTSPTSPRSKFSHPRGHTAVLPPSPASTSSTKKSSIRPEYIIVIISAPDPECKLSMTTVSTEYSIISQDIVENRLSDHVHIETIADGPIRTPYQSAPSGVLTSYCQVELTWRRISNNKTHKTTFHIVQDEIDSDVLLGEIDSGQGDRFNTTMGAQSLGRHETIVMGQPEMKSPIPQKTRPFPPIFAGRPEATMAESYHRSSHIDRSLTRTPISALHQGLSHGHPPRIDPSEQLSYRQNSPQYSHHPGAGPSSGDYSQQRSQPAAGNSSPLSQIHKQSPLSEEVRVECTWNGPCTVVKLELNASAECFLLNLENKFKRDKRKLDRNSHSIRFTVNKEAPGAYILYLEESTLIGDWESAINWIKRNRSSKAPHLYAMVEHDDEHEED